LAIGLTEVVNAMNTYERRFAPRMAERPGVNGVIPLRLSVPRVLVLVAWLRERVFWDDV
jgi:hypothetical protein